MKLKFQHVEIKTLLFGAEITYHKSGAILLTWQSAIGPSLGLSNEILFILLAHGAAELLKVKV